LDKIYKEKPENHSNNKFYELNNLQNNSNCSLKQNGSMDAKIKHRKKREGD